MILVENPFTAWYLGNLKIRMIKEELQVKRAKAQICSTTSTQKQISNTNHFFHVRICVPNSYMCASIKPPRPYIPSETKAGFNYIHTYLCKSTHGFMQGFWTIHSIMAGVLSAMRIFLLFYVSFIRKKNQEFHFTSFDALRTSFWLTLSLHSYEIYFVLTDLRHIIWPFSKLFGDFTTK